MGSRTLSPLLGCEPAITPDESGISVAPHAVDEQFQKGLAPFFSGAEREQVDVDDFAFEVGGWLPRLEIVTLLAVDGRTLFDVVQNQVVYGWWDLLIERERVCVYGTPCDLV